ncbi:MAG: tetratricopeptide repeat protein [Bryobacteraceae bacterium]
MGIRWSLIVLAIALFGRVLKADFAAGMKAYESRDYATAAKEWRPLADSGDAAAQFNLGLMYLDGTGVPQSVEHSVEWFRRSADRGYTKAQYNLGAMYAVGRGVRRDYISAHMWLNLCAASGDEKCIAQRDLVAKRMKARDLQAAQRRAAEWKPIPAMK